MKVIWFSKDYQEINDEGCFGLHGMSLKKVCHQILKQKLFSSSFEVITVSLDGSQNVQ